MFVTTSFLLLEGKSANVNCFSSSSYLISSDFLEISEEEELE